VLVRGIGRYPPTDGVPAHSAELRLEFNENARVGIPRPTPANPDAEAKYLLVALQHAPDRTRTASTDWLWAT